MPTWPMPTWPMPICASCSCGNTCSCWPYVCPRRRQAVHELFLGDIEPKLEARALQVGGWGRGRGRAGGESSSGRWSTGGRPDGRDRAARWAGEMGGRGGGARWAEAGERGREGRAAPVWQ
eukprot:1923391-Prymnesium_polylepis.1